MWKWTVGESLNNFTESNYNGYFFSANQSIIFLLGLFKTYGFGIMRCGIKFPSPLQLHLLAVWSFLLHSCSKENIIVLKEACVNFSYRKCPLNEFLQDVNNFDWRFIYFQTSSSQACQTLWRKYLKIDTSICYEFHFMWGNYMCQ